MTFRKLLTDRFLCSFFVLWIRIRKFMGLSDPDPSLSGKIRILPLSSKKVRKNLISTILCLFWDFLSWKTDANVPSESNKQKNVEKTYFLLASWKSLTKRAGSESGSQWYGSADPDPDPYQDVKDSTLFIKRILLLEFNRNPTQSVEILAFSSFCWFFRDLNVHIR